MNSDSPLMWFHLCSVQSCELDCFLRQSVLMVCVCVVSGVFLCVCVSLCVYTHCVCIFAFRVFARRSLWTCLHVVTVYLPVLTSICIWTVENSFSQGFFDSISLHIGSAEPHRARRPVHVTVRFILITGRVKWVISGLRSQEAGAAASWTGTSASCSAAALPADWSGGNLEVQKPQITLSPRGSARVLSVCLFACAEDFSKATAGAI